MNIGRNARMSMPVIKMSDDPISMCQAVTDLVESIALEETAMSHILNAEGEKLQKALEMDIDVCKLLEVNDSATDMVHAIANLELVLKDKLEFIANNLYYPSREEPSENG
jgi:hypothetical protein